MDKKFLEEYNLVEAQKRFQQICEYTFISNGSLLTEEGEEDEQDPNMPQGQGNEQMPPQDPNAMGGQDMGQMDVDPNMSQGQGNEQMPPQDPNAMGGMEDLPTEEEVPVDDNGMPMDDSSMDMETMEPGDEVIDVDDLTQSQQAAEIKIDDVDEKLTTLLNVVNKFSAAIEQNDQKIMDLKAEIEKRNPTEEEKLNLRSQAAYPYNVQPKSYWDEKTKNSNYKVTYDNEIPTAEEDKDDFTFTKKDLKGINDVDVAKSFDEYNQLSDFIKF